MFRILKVTGNSLFPLYQEGDFVLMIKSPFLGLRHLEYQEGHIVVIQHPYYGILIKIIEEISADHKQLFVVGTNPDSIDSRQFGWVELNWILGKVIWQIKKRR